MRALRATLLVALAVCGTGPVAPREASAAEAPEDPLAEPVGIVDLFPLGLRVPASPYVGKGLGWLAAKQQKDGRWSGRVDGVGSAVFDPGVTGLAVMAFLGAGYGPAG